METSSLEGVSRFQAPVAGPTIVISGGIHGDEPCGAAAVQRLERELRAGRLMLESGQLILIVGNPRALEANLRCVEKNLNRLFKDNTGETDCYEVRRAEELKPLLASCHYLLDLHSTSSPSPPFLTCEEHELELARQLGVRRVMIGWQTLGSPGLQGDTEGWARMHGAKALTLECGQHREAAAPELAYRSTLKFLSLLGAVKLQLEKVAAEEPLVIRLFAYQVMIGSGFNYSRTFSGFDRLEADELIGTDSATEYRADRACYIIMPVDPALSGPGKDLYFLAEPFGHSNEAD